MSSSPSPATAPSPPTEALTLPLVQEVVRYLKESAEFARTSSFIPLHLQNELIHSLARIAAEVEEQQPPPSVLAETMRVVTSDYLAAFPKHWNQPWLHSLRHMNKMLEPFRSEHDDTA